MITLLARLSRLVPVIVIIVIIALIIYFAVKYKHSKPRAKEALIKFFTWVCGAGIVAFGLAALYALAEWNLAVLELMGSFAIVFAIGEAITQICRAVFLKHNPEYRKKPMKSRRLR